MKNEETPKAMNNRKKSILNKIMGNYSTKIDLNKLRDLRKNEFRCSKDGE